MSRMGVMEAFIIIPHDIHRSINLELFEYVQLFREIGVCELLHLLAMLLFLPLLLLNGTNIWLECE